MITPLDATRMEQETRAAYPVLIDKIARDVAATLVVLKKTDDHMSEYFAPAEKQEHWEAIETRILDAARSKKGVKVRDLARIGEMARVLVKAASMGPLKPSEVSPDQKEETKPQNSVAIPRPEAMSEEKWGRALRALKGMGVDHSVENEVVRVSLSDDKGEADKLVEEVVATIFCDEP